MLLETVEPIVEISAAYGGYVFAVRRNVAEGDWSNDDIDEDDLPGQEVRVMVSSDIDTMLAQIRRFLHEEAETIRMAGFGKTELDEPVKPPREKTKKK